MAYVLVGLNKARPGLYPPDILISPDDEAYGPLLSYKDDSTNVI